MLAGFLLRFVHDRRLMREAQVNLTIRWFCGYSLHEMLPHHSSLTRIRQRCAVAQPGHRLEELHDLVSAQHDRQFLGFASTDNARQHLAPAERHTIDEP